MMKIWTYDALMDGMMYGDIMPYMRLFTTAPSPLLAEPISCTYLLVASCVAFGNQLFRAAGELWLFGHDSLHRTHRLQEPLLGRHIDQETGRNCLL